jgi:predicted lipoprotein with Yx(FWY)xxD motif
MSEGEPGGGPDRAASTGERVGARSRVLAVAVVAGLALAAACSSTSSSASSTSTAATTGTTAPSSGTATTGVAPVPTSTVPGTVVVTATSRGSAGVVLADGVDGPTLYRYTPDGTGPSTCTLACAQAWPPLVVSSASSLGAGSGVTGTLLGTVPRSDGTLQVTYKGMPLYRFAGDAHPNQATGEGVGGVWFVVHPADPAQGPATSTTASSAPKGAPY